LLIGTELARAWLVNRFGKRHTALAIGFAGVLFTLTANPLARFTTFQLEMESINVIGQDWLPRLAESLLATMLVMYSGPKASLVYRGLLAAFWWFCPMLPALDWAFKAVIGCMVPFLGMVLVNHFAARPGQTRKQENENSFPLGWILTTIACILIIWFAVGLFPVKPSVIPTGSMVPVYNPGDIVMVLKVSPRYLKTGDIIEYRTETMNVVHRIIKIDKNGNFITKGDANSKADTAAVDPRNVTGKVVFSIPRIGWISIAVKQLFA
jgi:signal peptidase